MHEYILGSGEKLNIELYSFDDRKVKDNPGIYIIVNCRNLKAYVGQSEKIKTRVNKHVYSLRKKSHYNMHLQRAFNRDSEEFKVGVIEYLDVADECILSKMESFFINKFKTLNAKYGYNHAIPPNSELKTFQKRVYRHSSRTSKEMLLEICNLLNSGLTRTEVAKRMGVNEPVISGITSGANHSDITSKHLNNSILAQWKHNVEKTGLTEGEKMEHITNKARPSSAKLSKLKVIKICKFMNEGLGDSDISKIMNIAVSTINNVRRGKNWNDISILFLNPEILTGRVFHREDLIKVGFSDTEANKKIYKSFSKLTEEDVHDICKDIASGTMSVRDIAQKYNINTASVRGILKGQNYKEISSQYLLNNSTELLNSHLSDEDVEKIWEYHLAGRLKKEIGELTGVNLTKIRRILRGACYVEAYEKYSKLEQATQE